MEWTTGRNGGQMTVHFKGRLDSVTAPEAETAILPQISGATELLFDFTELEYLSSAGIRLVLQAMKKMAPGRLILTGVNKNVMEIFEMTHLTSVLTLRRAE